MIVWGVTAGSHDAAIAVFVNDELVFAEQSERSSKIKNDKNLNLQLVTRCIHAGGGLPEKIYWYENHWLKRLRQLRSGQWRKAFSTETPRKMMDNYLTGVPIVNIDHHHSHAAAGYYTSKFDNAAVLVIDAIGEFETITMWAGKGNTLKRVYSQNYPNSLGLWYSAMTHRIGLKPAEEEYILMGWAALGDPERLRKRILKDFFHDDEFSTHYAGKPAGPLVELTRNVHKGCADWAPELNTIQDYADIAAATQSIYEEYFDQLLAELHTKVKSDNLVLMGGSALNCVANRRAYVEYDNVWIMPSPGDSGSAIGAVLASTKKHIDFNSPYLGHEILGDYPVEELLKELTTVGIVGVANGRAEFGPRALGNRSLLADPRGSDIKDRVNEIKRRQSFRPFAPVILEEHLLYYFRPVYGQHHMKVTTSPYMQVVMECKYPDKYPAIVHYDNTSRVQTVNKDNHPQLHRLLTLWYKETGCPMLLNTSLNIKGQPVVDTPDDARAWEAEYGVKVLTQ